MAEAAAVNASPVIVLARGGWLNLLEDVAGRVVVPRAVTREIERRGEDDPAVQALRRLRWLEPVETPVVPGSVLTWDLGAGESAVLAWALAHPGAEAIIDDLKARRCAGALGVPVRGTVGLVLRGKQRGLVPAARPVLVALREAGLYLSDTTMNRALMMVDEDP